MDYFDRLEADTKALYEIANEARSKGLDVETKSEGEGLYKQVRVLYKGINR